MENNKGKIHQDGKVPVISYTTQEGDYNDAYQTQFNTGGPGADENTATIEQLEFLQRKAYQSQVGEENDASINQDGEVT